MSRFKRSGLLHPLLTVVVRSEGQAMGTESANRLLPPLRGRQSHYARLQSSCGVSSSWSRSPMSSAHDCAHRRSSVIAGSSSP